MKSIKNLKNYCFPFFTLIFIVTFLFILSLLNTTNHKPVLLEPGELVAMSGVNLIPNGDFESSQSSWSVWSENTTLIQGAECYSGGCVKINGSDGLSQSLGSLTPGKTYKLSAKFKTSFLKRAYISIYDNNWNNTACVSITKHYNAISQGNGSWQNLETYFTIPLKDPCGTNTVSHRYTAYLYAFIDAKTEDLYYDNMALEEVSPRDIDLTELEEKPELFMRVCNEYKDNWNYTECSDRYFKETTDKVSGSSSLVMRANRTLAQSLTINIPVEDNSTYKIKYRLKFKDRVVYSITSLPPKAERDSWTQNLQGVWAGAYGVSVDDNIDSSGGNAHSELDTSPSFLYGKRVEQNIDWWDERFYVKPRKGVGMLSLNFKTIGFEGDFMIDGISVEKVDSYLEDEYFHTNITYEYEGMKIVSATQNPAEVKTNAGIFRFQSNQIVVQKEGSEVSRIVFPSGFLSELTLTRETGNIVLENSNVLISVGADSVLLMKLHKAVNLSVIGPHPGAHYFEAGIIFSTDYKKGIVFAPLRSAQEIASMPIRYDSRYGNPGTQYYDDSDFEAKGMKFWDVTSDFSQPTWQVDYSFDSGSGFMAELFPPKEFNMTKYCDTNIYHTGLPFLNESYNYSYQLQNYKDTNRIAFLYNNIYKSENNLNPPEYYCVDNSGNVVDCSVPGAIQTSFGLLWSIEGPYEISNPTAMHNYVNAAHQVGTKVVVYTGPAFYYSSQSDVLLADLKKLLDDYNIDGFYYDGVIQKDPLYSLELVRKTRNMLQDKLYIQHDSTEGDIFPGSRYLRIPFRSIYADMVWNGEGNKPADDNEYLLNYCGNNVSNTASMVLAEIRPVDYSSGDPSKYFLNSLTPEQQMDKMLACGGKFNVGERGTISNTYDPKTGYQQTFSTDYYYKQLDQICLAALCGNGQCNSYENVNNCPEDCAKSHNFIEQSWIGNVNSCEFENGTVTQWFLDDKPLYVMHYTFDGALARNDSENYMDISQEVGFKSQYYVPSPTPQEVDGNKAFYFDGNNILYSTESARLNLTNKDFSMFLKFKQTQSNAREVLFSFPAGDSSKGYGSVLLGINSGGVPFAEVTNTSMHGTANVVSEVASGVSCYQGSKCLRLQHNQATSQGASSQGIRMKNGTYNLSTWYYSVPERSARLSISTRDWRNATGNIEYKYVYSTATSGTNSWKQHSMIVTIPEKDDNGNLTANFTWLVSPSGNENMSDNNPIFYDLVEITGVDNPENILVDDFENGFGKWSLSSYVPPTTLLSGNAVNDGNWHTLGLVYSKPTVRFYVDGILAAENGITIDKFRDYRQYFYIGAEGKIYTPPIRASSGFYGYIDDLFISDRALTSQQVKDYNSSLLGNITTNEKTKCIVLSEGQYLSASLCGNGVTNSFEQCDDGNIVDGDGCSSICITENNNGGKGNGGGDDSGDDDNTNSHNGGGNVRNTPKSCTENSICEPVWSECIDEKESRYCYDINTCNISQSHLEYRDCKLSLGDGNSENNKSIFSQPIVLILILVVAEIFFVVLAILIVIWIVSHNRRSIKREAVLASALSK